MTNPIQSPLPPEPFVSWLDFAVARLPVRELELEGLFDENLPAFSRDDFRRAAQAELTELRNKAGECDSFPTEFRTPSGVRGHP
jgi:hypothetical protein